MIWNEVNTQRIVLDMAAQIQRTPASGLVSPVPYKLDLNKDLGMSSLSLMTLAAHVNEFFGLFETSAENYLLTDSVLDHWVQKILRARQQHDRQVVFHTSGTIGKPKRVGHAMERLLEEARVLMELLPRPDQVISTVPAHHIYGFIHTVLLPALWNVPVRSLYEINAAALSPDSLIIGTPFTWEYMLRTLVNTSQHGYQGVCSTAPLSSFLFSKLEEKGISILDVYGSTDTGGIAYRHSADSPYQLFSHVKLSGNPISYVSICGNNVPLPDRIEQVSERQIRIIGRMDGGIQIAGVNIFPAVIQNRITDCPLVAECDLYAKAVEGQSQLFCSIRLRNHTEQTEKACRNWLSVNLSSPEVPQHIQFY